MTPSFHSTGTLPLRHTRWNSSCSALLTGSSAHFSSSGQIPSSPAARPFFNFLIARRTSSSAGASDAMSGAGLAVDDSMSRSAHDVARKRWLILKIKVKVMHILTVNMSQTLTDRANITIWSHIDFRLPYLDLTLDYSEGQLGHRNSVSSKFWPSLTALLISSSEQKVNI